MSVCVWGGGAPTPEEGGENLLFGKIFVKNWMKIKEIGSLDLSMLTVHLLEKHMKLRFTNHLR